MTASDLLAPLAPPRAKSRRHHGIVRSDPWAWIDELGPAELTELMDQNNAHVEAATQHLEHIVQSVERSIRRRTPRAARSLLVRKGRWLYYSRASSEHQGIVYCRTLADSASGEEEVVLNAARLAGGHDYFALGTYDVSPDGAMVAFAVDHEGDERYELRVRDVDQDVELPLRVGGVSSGGAWSRTGKSFYYLTSDSSGRSSRLWSLDLASGHSTLVHDEPDPASWVTVDLTRSGRYLLVTVQSHDSSTVHAVNARERQSALVPVGPARVPGTQVQADHGAGGLWFLTMPAGRPARLWQSLDRTASELVPVRFSDESTCRLLTVDAFADHVVVQTSCAGRRGIRVLGAAGTCLDLPSVEGSTWVSLTGNPDHQSNRVRWACSSVVAPPTTIEHDLTNGRTQTLESVTVPDWDPNEFVVETVTVSSSDGAQVPMTVVCRDRLGPRPALGALLEVYGAYDETVPLAFDPARLPFLESGGIYAFAHVRGGGDGPITAAAGPGDKPRALEDLLACTTALTSCWVDPGQVVLVASSAGAVLAAAAVNRCPEQYAGLVLDSPFLDPLGTLLDDEAPLTTVDRVEWGDPSSSVEDYRTIASYAPYDNVGSGPCPPVLVFTAAHDGRVSPREALKHVARLRQQRSGGPFLIRTEPTGGHLGSTAPDSRQHLAALVTAWALDVLTGDHQSLGKRDGP